MALIAFSDAGLSAEKVHETVALLLVTGQMCRIMHPLPTAAESLAELKKMFAHLPPGKRGCMILNVPVQVGDCHGTLKHDGVCDLILVDDVIGNSIAANWTSGDAIAVTCGVTPGVAGFLDRH